MLWRQVGAAAVALALVTVGTAPVASASQNPHEAEGTTSTGDADAYGVWERTDPHGIACPAVLQPWTITLTLLEPSAGDRVLLSAQSSVPPEVTDAAVATYEDPTAVLALEGGGCVPFTEVVGLTVAGDTPYRITWSR